MLVSVATLLGTLPTESIDPLTKIWFFKDLQYSEASIPESQVQTRLMKVRSRLARCVSAAGFADTEVAGKCGLVVTPMVVILCCCCSHCLPV